MDMNKIDVERALIQKSLLEHYIRATDNAFTKVKISDGSKNIPIYNTKFPNIDILGAAEVVGLHEYMERAINGECANVDGRYPYSLDTMIKNENGSWITIPIFDKSEFITDPCPGLNIQERITILENADPCLIKFAARNLAYYHEMNLYNKGKQKYSFQLNGWDGLPRDLLSEDLMKRIITSPIPNYKGHIQMPSNKEEDVVLHREFPPLYFEAIKEIIELIKTGHQTGREWA